MKTKHTEHTANLAMAVAPAIKVGANFVKPIPRKILEKKKSFWDKFKKL
jgi:hypothetical protein